MLDRAHFEKIAKWWSLNIIIFEDLEILVKNTLKRFIKSSVISNCSSVANLKAIDVEDKGNYIKIKEIIIGFVEEAYIAK